MSKILLNPSTALLLNKEIIVLKNKHPIREQENNKSKALKKYDISFKRAFIISTQLISKILNWFNNVTCIDDDVVVFHWSDCGVFS